MGQAERLKFVFMGTPDLAAAVLRHVLAWEGGRVLAVYCQPDRPAGRGMGLKVPPVKALALDCGLPVRQPVNFKNAGDVAALRELAPDYLLAAAYGLILPPAVLAAPRRLPLNVHTSLLPRHRGAAPIQRAVMNGDAETGVTIMVMEAGLDTGPIVMQRAVPIGPEDTAGHLHDVLAECGGKLLLSAVRGLESGELVPRPQDAANASYAAKLEKRDGWLDFREPCLAVHARARAVSPWPCAFAPLARDGGEALAVSILAGGPAPGLCPDALAPDVPGPEAVAPPAGTVLPKLVDKALAVRCADGLYLIRSLRPSGRGTMDAAAFMNGYLKGCGTARFVPPE